eukprot:272089-Pyramimonas_sp.AAC.1
MRSGVGGRRLAYRAIGERARTRTKVALAVEIVAHTTSSPLLLDSESPLVSGASRRVDGSALPPTGRVRCARRRTTS